MVTSKVRKNRFTEPLVKPQTVVHSYLCGCCGRFVSIRSLWHPQSQFEWTDKQAEEYRLVCNQCYAFDVRLR